MNKCVSILLIIFLFLNSGGFIIVFYQAQHSAKTQMFEYIKRGSYTADEVVKFRLNKEHLFSVNSNRRWGPLVWINSHEFECKGSMYDIIEIVKEKDQVIIYCLNDISEARIKAAFSSELNDLAAGKLNNSKYRTCLLNLISQALCITQYKSVCPQDWQNYPFEKIACIPVCDGEIPSPPPKEA